MKCTESEHPETFRDASLERTGGPGTPVLRARGCERHAGARGVGTAVRGAAAVESPGSLSPTPSSPWPSDASMFGFLVGLATTLGRGRLLEAARPWSSTRLTRRHAFEHLFDDAGQFPERRPGRLAPISFRTEPTCRTPRRSPKTTSSSTPPASTMSPWAASSAASVSAYPSRASRATVPHGALVRRFSLANRAQNPNAATASTDPSAPAQARRRRRARRREAAPSPPATSSRPLRSRTGGAREAVQAGDASARGCPGRIGPPPCRCLAVRMVASSTKPSRTRRCSASLECPGVVELVVAAVAASTRVVARPAARVQLTPARRRSRSCRRIGRARTWTRRGP